MSYLLILGRQPTLSLAELESRFGASKVTPVESAVARVEADSVNLDTLGGSLKLAYEVGRLDNLSRDELVSALSSPLLMKPFSEDTKLPLGLSFYGFKLPARVIFSYGLELKKHLADQGFKVRLVPNDQPALTTAQVHHNRLVTKGVEWLVIKDGVRTLIGRTTAIQDIEAYGERDYGRPERSAKIGMLPPKLAQIMINLASPPPDSTVLDPFCGTGVVLQEALRMGFSAFGSDIDKELVAMSRHNLEWQNAEARLETADATSYQWKRPIGAVVTEGYLGPPQSSDPSSNRLKVLRADATALTLAFMRNLQPQITAGTPISITLPAWRQGKTYQGLDIIDQIKDLGYTHKQFVHATEHDLLYHRSGQIVARQLIVLIRN